MRPPTPSKSSVAPTSSGATSWTLRAKKLLRSFTRRSLRVVTEKSGHSRHEEPAAGDAREPTGDNREAQARPGGERPGLHVPERRGARDLGELNAREPASHRVRGHGQENRRAKDRAPVVGGTRQGEEEQGRPEAGCKAEDDDRRSPRRGPDAEPEPLPTRARDPAREKRCHERARVRRRVEKADSARAASEMLAEGREESARHAEDHRHRVDREDPL